MRMCLRPQPAEVLPAAWSGRFRGLGTAGALIVVAMIGGAANLDAQTCTAPESDSLQTKGDRGTRPNVVVLITDDLNDWVGCLGAHPQVRTPNIDRLAARGRLFGNAHVQATYCGPSRVSFLAGLLPHTTGSYDFTPYARLDSLTNHPPFPLQLRREGYMTFGGGKIFHEGTGNGWVSDSWDHVLPSGQNPRPPKSIHWEKRVWDWGAWPERDEQMGDFRLATNAAEVLRQKHERPFLLVAGFRRPHVPLHVPAKWFDLYPVDDVVLPRILPEDLDDVPHPEIGLTPHAAPVHAELVRRGLWRSLTQAYLASISFVDRCVGEVMQGLESGPNGENTIVVLFSDHGFHLGEKQHWAKRTLWEETTRVPLLITGPGIAAGQSSAPVGLIDLYPTLCDLTGVSPPSRLEGHSLKPLLDEPDSEWPHAAITTLEPGANTIRTRNWRYIRYADGTEELYDHRVDPHEWHNLADHNDKELADIRRQHARRLAEALE